MSGFFSRKRITPALLLCLLAPFGGHAAVPAPAAASMATQVTPLEASRQESKATRGVASMLDEHDYDHLKLDATMSSRIFDRFLKDLDPSHSYFLASDIQGFEPYRNGFGDALHKGDLKAAFAIYNRYQQRAADYLNYTLGELGKGVGKLDFTKDEYLETDREKAPWPASRTELEDLWRRRLKAAALSLRLDGKADADVQKTLIRRYRKELSILVQAKADDAFQIFMDSFTESYDPHTEYLSPRNSANFNINMSLSLEGIGAVLQSEDEYTKVTSLVTGGPADKSRMLKPGDRIVAVAQGNGELVDVVGWRIDEVVDLIRGPKGTTVRLEIIPADSDDHQTKVVSIVRNTVKLDDKAAQKKIITLTRDGHSYKIGVIKLPEFYADFSAEMSGDPDYRSATRDVRKLINELKAAGINGLVLDLRDNGGGSLQEANSMVGLFIETGPTVQVRDADGKVEVQGDPDPAVTYSGPLVCLVNRLSASATEIFAGAIQDYGRGLVVGSTTFGKGTVQAMRDIDNYGQLKITEDKFYRISGASTQNRGVVPDITLPNIYDNSQIGESALPNALPWDTVPAATYFPYQDFSKQLPVLREASRKRQAVDPDFVYLNDQIALNKSLREKTRISLSEARRRDEQKDLDARRLAIENKRRAAKGQPLLKTWHEADADKDGDGKDDDDDTPGATKKEKPEDTAFTTEAANILIDSATSETPVSSRTPKRKHDAWWD